MGNRRGTGIASARRIFALCAAACCAAALAAGCASAESSGPPSSAAVPAAAAGPEPAPGALAAARAPVDLERYRCDAPESRAAQVPAEIASLAFAKPKLGLPKLVAWLLEGQGDPYLKAKLLHDWEALNIRYDVKAYYSGRISDQSAYSVLSRRTAVCAGYSALYKALCDLGGIQCAVVSGEARGTNFSEGKGLMGHDWNAVRLDGVWRLVDVTWDSGYVNSPTEFADRYRSSYFLLDPEFMIYTHYPASSRMQLLDRAVSRSEFEDLPYADGEFLSITRRCLAGLSIEYKSKGLSTIDIPRAPGVMLGSSLVKGGSKAWSADRGSSGIEVPIIEGEGKSTFTLAFPSAGDYIFSVYAWKEAPAEGGSGSAKMISAGSCHFRFRSSGAYKPAAGKSAAAKSGGGPAGPIVGFDPAFQRLAGLPKEGGVLDSLVGKELSLTFHCGPETRLRAFLLQGDLSSGAKPVPGTVALSMVPGGRRVDVAFPEKGDYALSLSALAPGKKEAWTTLKLTATEAADHGYLSFPEDFLDLVGEPSGGAAVSDRAGPEFSLAFPSASGVSIEASLCTERKIGQNQSALWAMPDTKRLCIARRGPEGAVVKTAFPGPGSYCLWLEAKGPKGEKASASLRLKAGAGLGHGYFSLDPRIAELAGEPFARGPDGAALGAPSTDIVGSSLSLSFPKADAPLGASLFSPRRDGDSTKYDWLCSLPPKRGADALSFDIAFPKPGDYVIFFVKQDEAGGASQTFDGLFLTSR